MDEPPYHLDIDGIEDPNQDQAGAGRCGRAAPTRRFLRNRPWLGIHFDCCGVYTRIYRNPEGTAYRGQCPHCLRRVTLRVGPDGTDARFFIAQ